MTKAIMFDADGVTIVPGMLFSQAYEKKFKLEQGLMLPFFTGIFQDCLRGKKDIKGVLPEYFKEWNWQGTVDEFLDYWFESEHIINEIIINEIQELRKIGVKCFLVTNQEPNRAQYIKEKMGFDKLFDKLFFSSEIGFTKSEEQFFQSAGKIINTEYGIKKEEIIYFDDSEKDLASAKNFGIESYFYTNFDDFKKILISKKIYDK